jgi:putative membrane protein
MSPRSRLRELTNTEGDLLMKTTTVLASAISTCLLAGSVMAQDTDTRNMDRTRTPTGQSATMDEHSRDRTADASGMRRSKMDSKEFVKKAGAAGAAEVEAGQLGAQKATDPEVKAYAQKMVADHTQANKELMAAAKAKNLEVPTEPDLMHKGMMAKFEHQKADADFDHDFMQQMVRDHEAVVELFQQASTDQNVDADFRALAKKTLPTLQEHLKEAKRLESKLAKVQ